MCGPGTVLVFQSSDDRYDRAPHGPQWLSDAVVVNAVHVIAVSTSHVLVPTTGLLQTGGPRQHATELPRNGSGQLHKPKPPDPPHAVIVHAAFHCRVTDPVWLLENGWAKDVRSLLSHLLLDDPQLVTDLAGSDCDVGSLQEITARVLARGELAPPYVPGMTVELASGSVGVHLDSTSCPRCAAGSWMPRRSGPTRDGAPGDCNFDWEDE